MSKMPPSAAAEGEGGGGHQGVTERSKGQEEEQQTRAANPSSGSTIQVRCMVIGVCLSHRSESMRVTIASFLFVAAGWSIPADTTRPEDGNA